MNHEDHQAFVYIVGSVVFACAWMLFVWYAEAERAQAKGVSGFSRTVSEGWTTPWQLERGADGTLYLTDSSPEKKAGGTLCVRIVKTPFGSYADISECQRTGFYSRELIEREYIHHTTDPTGLPLLGLRG